jgi:hypothetical protein
MVNLAKPPGAHAIPLSNGFSEPAHDTPPYRRGAQAPGALIVKPVMTMSWPSAMSVLPIDMSPPSPMAAISTLALLFQVLICGRSCRT